jgi:hypothetical protein
MRQRRIPDEPEIQTSQEQNEMNDGSHTTDLGRLDNAGSDKWNRNVYEIEIELHPATHEKGSGEKFPELSAANS